MSLTLPVPSGRRPATPGLRLGDMPRLRLPTKATKLDGIIFHEETARAILQRLARVDSPVLGFDTETTGWAPEDKVTPYDRARCAVLSLSDGVDSWAISGTLLSVFKPLFERGDVRWRGVNLKFDAAVLWNHGVDLRGRYEDCRILSRLRNVVDPLNHGLKNLAKHFLGVEMVEFRDIAKMSRGRNPTTEFLLDNHPMALAKYARHDAEIPIRLGDLLVDRLQAIPWIPGKSLWDLFLEFEEPFTHVLLGMERRGVNVNQDKLAEIKVKVEREVHELHEQLEEIAGGEINPRSPDQLVHLFYDKLGYGPSRFSEKKFVCTAPECGDKVLTKTHDRKCPRHGRTRLRPVPLLDKFALQDLAAVSPEARVLQRFRKVDQYRKNFIPHLSKPCFDGKVRTSWRQSGARSWRLCVSADTLVEAYGGHQIRIDEIVPGVPVRTHADRYRRVTAVTQKQIEHMYDVHVEGGRRVRCTYMHRLWSGGNHWTHLADLAVGDLVVCDDGAMYPITAIEPAGPEPVWDITVEEDHSYVAQGLVHHNSGSAPNLMNIPARFDDPDDPDPLTRGFGFRKLFEPDEGKVFVVADLSQVELCIGAHLSGDPTMIAAYTQGLDLHSEAAKALFELPCAVEDVAELYPTERGRAKTLNFGIFYGAGVKRVMNEFRISRQRARQALDNYFRKFPGIEGYKAATEAGIRRLGYKRSLLGRYHHFPMMHRVAQSPALQQRYHEDEKLRSRYQAEFREATNFGCQGGAADCIQSAMLVADGHPVEWHPAVQDSRLLDMGAEMLMQIHDEIVLQVDERHGEEAGRIVQELMTDPIPGLRVPITAGVSVSKEWSK